MMLTELAVMNGTASVHIPGHLATRQREWRKTNPVPQTGRANVAGWTRLAELFEQSGVPVQHSGDRLVN